MSRTRNRVSFILIFFCLTSCMVTDSIYTVQIEIMKPGIFTLHPDIDTIAIFKRDYFQSDTCKFRYFSVYKTRLDTTVKYRNLSNHCVDALANYLKQEGYFREVINYRDSLNYQLKNPDQQVIRNEFFRKTRSDMCVFLDYLNFSDNYISNTYEDIYTKPSLTWTIAFRTDTSTYVYHQMDTLSYKGAAYSIDHVRKKGPELFMMNSSEYLGKFFGTKIIPSWLVVERVYYKSHNPRMLEAEKYALNNEWLKAAEIWNKETKNNNRRIAAKACFNMALACEMEAKLDLSVSWLVKSYSCLKINDEYHKANCQRYVNVIAMRKKEIERLGKQIRNRY